MLETAREHLAKLNINNFLEFLDEYPPPKHVKTILNCVLTLISAPNDGILPTTSVFNISETLEKMLEEKNSWPLLYTYIQSVGISCFKQKMLGVRRRVANCQKARCLKLLSEIDENDLLSMNKCGNIIFDWVRSLNNKVIPNYILQFCV